MSLSERTRNSEVLESFVSYAKAHPEQRLWQALRNWAGVNFIYVSEHQAQEFQNPEDAMTVYNNLQETFYWEGKDG